MSEDSFYKPHGEFWESTEMTRGPWSPNHQHAGPPAALLARAMEGEVGAGYRFARLNIEIFRPVPIARLRVYAELQRPGRTVRYVMARVEDEAGEVLMQAVGLAVREKPLQLPAVELPREPDLPDASNSRDFAFPFFTADVGYHTAMQLALARGEFGKGPCAMWMRMRIPLVADEQPTPLQRVMAAADSGNGVSMVLDPEVYGFVNPDLSVYLHRYPAGEWLCLDAGTAPEPDGIGLAVSVLRDEGGVIGRGLQSLVISERR